MRLKMSSAKWQSFCPGEDELTHWGRVMHIICVSKVTIIVSDSGLSPGRRQAIIWNNAGILLIGPLGTNFSGILIEIHTFSFKKMPVNVLSAKWRPFCLGLNVLNVSELISDSSFRASWYPVCWWLAWSDIPDTQVTTPALWWLLGIILCKIGLSDHLCLFYA